MCVYSKSFLMMPGGKEQLFLWERVLKGTELYLLPRNIHTEPIYIPFLSLSEAPFVSLFTIQWSYHFLFQSGFCFLPPVITSKAISGGEIKQLMCLQWHFQGEPRSDIISV